MFTCGFDWRVAAIGRSDSSTLAQTPVSRYSASARFFSALPLRQVHRPVDVRLNATREHLCDGLRDNRQTM